MKILYICSDTGIPVLGRKGASIHVRSLASAFTRAGHSVVIATPLLTKSPWETPATCDATILHVPADEDVVSAVDSIRSYTETVGLTNTLPGEMRRILYNQQLEAKLLRRFKDDPPDFIYERAALYSTVGLAVARVLGIPFVVELNAPLALEQATYRGSQLPALGAHAESLMLNCADVVLAVSAPLRQYVIERGAVPARVYVAPNGIDERAFVPGEPSGAVRARWGLGPGPVLGFVGGLRPWHGVRALPGLLETMVQTTPGVQMVVAGDGPLRDDLADDFACRGLASRVVFTGSVPHEDVPDLVRLFDIALAPYDESEHLFYFSPLKLFEYLGCGVPVVAAGLGQIADVVRQGQTGMLYPPGDVNGLAAACERLLNDPSGRMRIGRAAAADVHRRFTWKANAQQVIELVEQVRPRSEVAA